MKRILIIDDDDKFGESIEDLLKNAGYDALLKDNGADGIQSAIEYLPDIILCDIMMPGVSGYEVYEILKDNSVTAQIPFVFITAKKNKEDQRMGMHLGVDDYITKPYEIEDLFKTVKTQIEKSEHIIKGEIERMYRVATNLSIPACIIDEEDTFMFVNTLLQNTLGFDAKQLVGQSIAIITEGADKITLKEKFNLVKKGFQPKPFIFTVNTGSKEKLNFAGSCFLYQIHGTNYIFFQLYEQKEAATAQTVLSEQYLNEVVSFLASEEKSVSLEFINKLNDIYTKRIARDPNLKSRNPFSNRELDVLTYLIKGHSSQKIADLMNVSYRTIEGHRRAMINKTGVKNILGVIVYAIRNNLIEI